MANTVLGPIPDGEEKLQFEVNGQDYFLNFAEDEAYWYVLAPSLTGVQRIPVYVDSPSYERFGILGKTVTIF